MGDLAHHLQRVHPQINLRNSVGEVLRQAEGGTEFTITVRGRPAARLGPLGDGNSRRVNVWGEALRKKLIDTPVDKDFAGDIARLREFEAPAKNPWPG